METDTPNNSLSVEKFYDELTPYFHLVYADWDASVLRQSSALDSIIRERFGSGPLDILDVACGIGTQTLGLAKLGHHVSASDISEQAINRAKREADKRGLQIDVSVADMRHVDERFANQFDLVIACDNVIPHLLTNEEIVASFVSMKGCLRSKGGLMISVRDYANEKCTGTQIKPYGIKSEGGSRFLVFQVWDFNGPIYELSMYLIEDRGIGGCTTHVMRTRYYAISIAMLSQLLLDAGFIEVERIDDRFFQPVLFARKPN